MLSFGFPIRGGPVRPGESFEDAVARTADGAEARRVLGTWTRGTVRYRLAWSGGGHRRALAFGVAAAIARRAQARPAGGASDADGVPGIEWMNDPTASLWEIVVSPPPAAGASVRAGAAEDSIDLDLVTRGLEDPRFAWRRRDVPAASHPTIAAALVQVAGVRADDVVWDPFVGSGAELVERALAGPFASLLGTDLDERALAAARENLSAARVNARLERADALVHEPSGVTLVITNPPMGRRASRTEALAGLLDRFLERMGQRVAPGGRLVWITPWAERSRDAGARAGLSLDWTRTIDMGGFDAELQRWVKRR
jgi:predicted RNA methylase